MNKHSCIAIAALALGVAVLSPSAFAQNGPGAANFGAGSNPLTGSQPFAAQPAAQGRAIYDVVPQGSQTPGPAGPAGAYFGAGSNPQTGNQPAQPVAQSARQQLPQPGTQTAGPAGPAGANFGAGSNPQTGR